jgi:hypothetical protein
MTDRDADAEKLAGAMGWRYLPATAERRCAMFAPVGIVIPAASAPLGEQFAFVGKLAEQLGCERPRVVYGPEGWIVNYSDETLGMGYDLVHAAIRAALAAKGAT